MLIFRHQDGKKVASPEQMQIYLQPVTATIKSLPPHSGVSTYLPRFGSQGQMTEEEIRESLRRFINNWQTLIGADPSQLSLVDRIDQPDGSKLANYEQRPSRYPLRGNYGRLQIQFTSDRRLLNLSSTCLPDADHWQSAIAALPSQVDREAAVKHLLDSGASYRDATGSPRIYPLSANNRLNARELVVYVFPSKTVVNALELHLAWEIEVANASFKTIYVDAVNGETIATS